MVGFAICGSFCNFKEILKILSDVKEKYGEVTPIFSYNARNTDTRFFNAENFYEKVKEISGNEPITDIVGAEPIGPKHLFDMLLICPCTGNTLAKLAYGITDTPVTMAVKSHLRCGGKVVIALSTNDALSGAFEPLARLMNRKNIFFVPLRQDDCKGKPSSLSFIKPLVLPTLETAYKNEQLQPILEAPDNK